MGYEGLDGEYMRQTAFDDLLRAGYIGNDTDTAENLRTLIASVLTGNEAPVVAVQRLTHPHEKYSDHQRRVREWEEDTVHG